MCFSCTTRKMFEFKFGFQSSFEMSPSLTAKACSCEIVHAIHTKFTTVFSWPSKTTMDKHEEMSREEHLNELVQTRRCGHFAEIMIL